MVEQLGSDSSNPAEEPSPRELITPDGVKRRVMEFFKDVDLEQVGEKNVGLVTIKTESYPNLPEMRHQATLNGFTAAEYSHIPHSATLEQLQKGKDRRTAVYVLRGFIDHREVSVVFIEYEQQAAVMEVRVPSVIGLKTRSDLKELSEFAQRSVCELLGIKI